MKGTDNTSMKAKSKREDYILSIVPESVKALKKKKKAAISLSFGGSKK